MDCSGPKIKKMLYFHKKAFLVLSETELYTPKTKKFQKGILRASKMKKKPHSERISYVSRNGTFYPQA